MNVYRYVSREQIEQYLYRVVFDLLIDVVEECSQGLNVRKNDKRFIADFYKYGFVGLMLEWIQHDMKQDPKEIVSQLNILIDGDVKRALEKQRQDKSASKMGI